MLINQIANIDLVKQMNSATVYQLIDQQGPISRIQIAELSRLAPASVTKITKNLLSRGLIKEVEQQESTGGRRATSIVAERKHFQVVVLHIGHQQATIGLMDLSGKLLHKAEVGLPYSRHPADIEAVLIEQLHDFINRHRKRSKEIIALGITTSGFINSKANRIEQLPYMRLESPWELPSALSAAVGLPAYIGNDVRSLALAEHYFGTTKDCYDSLLLRIHNGVGAGIVINHEVFLGHKNNVGEIGHIQIDPLGKRCNCGNVGCLETVVSNGAIEEKMQSLLQDGYRSRWLSLESHDIEAICKASNNQDKAATELIEYVGTQIGRVLAMSVNMFNPEKIVISGEITQAKNVLFAAIRRALEAHALPSFVNGIPLVESCLENEELIGAFAMVKQALFNGLLLKELLTEPFPRIN